jgi:hypothetical protein
MRTIRRRRNLSEISIYRFINRCRKELRICRESHACLAGVVLIGASLEYLLAAWIRAYPNVVYGRHRRLSDHWSLKELNELAYQERFFDRSAFHSSERIRKSRNLVHPNWYAARRPLRFTKRMLEARLSDYNSVIDSIQRNL